MNRATFLRWVGASVASAWWLQAQGGAHVQPAFAQDRPADVAADVAAREVPPEAVDALAAADRAVDAAYRACADGGWTMDQQRRYLRAAIDAARAWRRHAPWDGGGQNHFRLVVDVATDVGWDPRQAPLADRSLVADAARFTARSPNGEMHPARAKALLAKLGVAR